MSGYDDNRRWRSIKWMATIVACAMMASVVAPSVAVADQADGLEALRDANDAFDEENFEEAYDNYEKAYEILGVEMIKYRLGQTAEQLGWAERAIDHYEVYREIGDDEEFLSRIDDALPELREQIQVTVEVISEPEGATVSVEEPAGEYDDVQTPAQWTMEPGQLAMTLRLEGYEDKSLEEVLEAGEEFVWEATLTEKEQEADEEPEPVAEIEVPDDEVEEVKEEVEEIKEEKPAEMADFEDVEDLDEPDSSLRLWGWTSTGVGISLLAFGGVMSVFQSRTTDEVNELDRASAGAQTESFEERQELRHEQQALRDDAQTYYRLSTGAYITGGVLTAAGAGLLLHSALGSTKEGTDEGLSIQGGISSEGGVVGIGGRF